MHKDQKIEKPCNAKQFIKDAVLFGKKDVASRSTYKKGSKKQLSKLIDQKYLVKLNKYSDKYFISPIVIAVKRDQTVRLALDSKKCIKFIHKSKYQMPEVDLLLDIIKKSRVFFKTRSSLRILANSFG